jgi:hypothetical protein
MKLFSRFQYPLHFVALLLVVSCSGSWSKDDENFVQTYTEVLIAREQYPNDTTLANASINKILQRHGFTEIVFRQRFNDLASKPEKLRQMLDSARNRARRIGEEESEKERKAKEKEQKETEKTRQDSAAKASTQAPGKEAVSGKEIR